MKTEQKASKNSERKDHPYWRAIFSVTLFSFYGLFIALIVAVSFFF